MSVILVDDHTEAKDLFEKVRLGSHRKPFDGCVFKARQAEPEFAALALDLELGYSLGVGAFEGVRDTQDGSELGDADAVLRAQRGVSRVIQLRARMAVIAGNEGDDGDIEAIESEDLRV